MNFHKIRTMLISALVAVCSFGAVQAQTISVNGASCPGATVQFGANSIAINTSNCSITVIAPTINASTPPAGNTNVSYSHTFTASGSTPLTWTSSGALPGGLGLNASSGVLSGIPTGTGTSQFTVTAANAGGSSTPLSVSVTISAPSGPPVIQNIAPSTATVGALYSHQYTATGAAGITYTATGSLPPGITLASGGLLSGTPTVGAAYSFTVTAANGTLPDATQNVTITVSTPVAPAITSAAPPAGIAGSVYSFNFTASGTAPITWTTVAGGTLPPGLTLSSAGALAGTPTSAGTYSFAVKATNAAGSTSSPATGTYSVLIAPAPAGGAQLSLEGNAIPSPSKQPSQWGVIHPGLNGAGAKMNAWAVDPARCNNPEAPATSPPTMPAITRAWQHNIDYDNYSAGYSTDFFDMAPNEALSFRFKPSQLGLGTITLGETTEGPLPATFISLSTKPCDFDYTKLANGATRDFCYKSATRDNGMYFDVTNAATASITYCKLDPTKTYYFNVRFQDGRVPAAGGAATDSCAANGSPRCAGLFQIGR